MALFGSGRDASLFRRISRELMGNIISQQCVFYKFSLDKTTTNMYGEASGGRFYKEPIILNCLIDRGDLSSPIDNGFGVDVNQKVNFAFLRDDLVDISLLPEVGDIIMYYEAYYEVDNVNENQYALGKDPEHPYSPNPLNSGLENFGYNVSIVCNTHMTPVDKVNIINARL